LQKEAFDEGLPIDKDNFLASITSNQF